MEKIALLPGGFKPPHAGHYNAAKWLAANTDADTVVVKIGAKEREGVTREMSLQLWNLYRETDPDPLSKKLTILASNSNSPVRDVYDFVEKEAPAGSTIYLGMGEKDINDARFKNISKFAEPREIKFETKLVPPQAGGVSGTEMRGFIRNNQETFFFNSLPDHMTDKDKQDAWNIVTTQNEMMIGMMTEPEKKKHAKNLKRLKKDLKKQGDKYMEVPGYLKGTLTRKINEEIENVKDKLDFYKKYYENLSPSNLDVEIKSKTIVIDGFESNVNENYPPYKADQVQKVRYQASDTFTNSPKKAKKLGYLETITDTDIICDNCGWTWAIVDGGDDLYTCHKCDHDNTPVNEGDTYEKMAAKGKKRGNLKQGTVRKRLKIKDGEKIPLSKINQAISRIKKMANPSEKNKKFLKALNLAKTLKTTTHKENIDPKSQAKHKGKAAPYGSAYEPVKEGDPKKGTGKKPKGSGRRLYTDENPKDTVKVKFSTRQDIVDTLNKKSFKSKSHARQSQIINLIHQRVRAALNRAKDPDVKKRLRTAFDYIEKRKEASKRKTQRMKKEATFSKNWWKDIINEVLLSEGGAAGHMAHPFDLSIVKSGRDLINLFNQAAISLQNNPGSVKIDGVNSSIRLIDKDGKKQFVMDRGSKKPLDIKGITKDDLLARFGDGHGMVKVGGNVLDMFNEALPAIQNDLDKLGVLNDPNILFNMEYVSGKTNVQDYGSNFIAIHGLNRIEMKEIQGKRGPLVKRFSTEVKYDKNALQSLLDNLAPIAKKRGFEVYGSVPTQMKKKPNFNAALSKRYTVDFSEGSETKSLKQWLDSVNNIPVGDFIFMNVGYQKGTSTINRKKVGAVSKQVYLAILNGENVDDLFEDKNDRKRAIDGFVTYLATEKLGDEILKVLDSPMGSVENHEGVVIRDKSITPIPFKITGKFILGGLATDFR